MKLRTASTMSKNADKNLLELTNEAEIELQISTMLKFKYYGDHVMSRKFKYRYVGEIGNCIKGGTDKDVGIFLSHPRSDSCFIF